MKAVVITQPGGPEVLEIKDVPEPCLEPGTVMVKVHAVGVNRADLLQRRGRYPAPSGFPQHIPGLEYFGQVEALGEGVVRRQLGEWVMGVVPGGSYAEYLVVPDAETMRLPAGLEGETAAAIPEAYVTAWDALYLQAGLKPGESLLIHAVGSSVGLAAVQLARALGARSVGTSRSAYKLEAAKAHGLEAGVLATEGSLAARVREVTHGEGVDVVLDFVGGPYLTDNVQVLRPFGRLVVLGLLGGARGELPLDLVLRHRLHLMGSTLRARPAAERVVLAQRFEQEIIPLFEQGLLSPVIDAVMPMTRVQDAHRRLEADANLGKVILTWT